MATWDGRRVHLVGSQRQTCIGGVVNLGVETDAAIGAAALREGADALVI